MPSLREIQAWFQERVIHPDRADSPETSRPKAWIRETPRFSREMRLEVYSDAYGLRLHEALRDDYPVCEALVGDKAFWGLALGYFEAHPSRSHTLADLGREFPEFLGKRTDVPPFLADLARLEWALAQAFYQDEGRVLSPDDLARLGSADPSRIRLSLDPAVKILKSAYPVDRIYEEEEAHGAEDRRILVYRAMTADGERRFTALEPYQALLLGEIEAGRNLEEVFEALERAHGDEVSAEALQGDFQTWASEGVISGIRIAD